MKTQTKDIVLTKSGSLNKNVLNALKHCRFNAVNRTIHTGYYRGSGKWSQAASVSVDIIRILNAQGYKFTEGNDAPRGGAMGIYLKVSRTAFDFIVSLKDLK